MMVKIERWILLLVVAVGVIACDKEPEVATRPFYMGFTPFPYNNTLKAVDYTYAKIAANADMIDHHFDNGVPWVEALTDAEFHPNVMADWTYRKQHTPTGHKVYVSASALSFERNAMAKYRGEHEDMALPEPWNTYTFASEEVRIAYVNYCKRLISFFNPDYFNMNVEANLFYYFSPTQWAEFLGFHRYVYEHLKDAYPTLVVFSSVTGAHMLPGFIEGNDHVQHKLAVMQILDHSDLYALSFYPYLSSFANMEYPDNMLGNLLSVSDKPFAFAETGHAAENFSINAGQESIEILSSDVRQNAYMTDLLKACETRNALFVVNFVLRDYDSLWVNVGSPANISVAWRDSGLIDEKGSERQSFATWKDYRKRSVER